MSAHPKQPDEQTIAAEEKARARDPHGAAVAEQAADEKPTGLPTDDRHEAETAAGT